MDTDPLVFDYVAPKIVTERVGIRTRSGEIITVNVTFSIYDDGSIGCYCERL